MKLDRKQKSFIRNLLNLAKEGQENRGALADLRSGLGREPAEMSRVHRHVVQYLPEKDDNDPWYYLIATLFGAFPQHRQGRSLGAAFSPLRQKSGSMETRFIALLNAHSDDLGDHLRHVISLLRANEQPFDWFQFFWDLLEWDRADGRVQLGWARDYYRSEPGETGSATVQNDSRTTRQEVEDHE